MTPHFELPPLPYAYDALAPVISKETLELHHDKHQRAYIDKTNKLAREAGLLGEPLEAIVKQAKGELFNNTAQAWNHTFFWNCMKRY